MFFLHQKNIWDSETCTHRLQTEVFTDRLFCTQKLYPEQFLHSRNFFAQKPLRTNKYAQQFFQTDGFYTQKVLRTEVLRTEGFYAQQFLHKDTFTHRCLYTDTNCTQIQTAHRNLCTQKLVHTECRVYTQPTFTQRGFAFPFSSLIMVMIFTHSKQEHCVEIGCDMEPLK